MIKTNLSYHSPLLPPTPDPSPRSKPREWCSTNYTDSLSGEIVALEMLEFTKNISEEGEEYFVSNKYPNDLIYYSPDKKVLGEGAFGKVFKGIYSKNGIKKDIVIKNIKRHPSNDDLCTEIVSLHKLNHPNVVKFYGFVVEKNYYYVFLEYINGKELEWYIKNNALTIKDKMNIAIQAIQGLKYLHSINVFHRDIKPANFMISKYNNKFILKYVDFGLSCSKNQTCNGADFMGTPLFMSPELFESEKKKTYLLNSKEDIKFVDFWALGVTLYYMFTKKFIVESNKSKIVTYKNFTTNLKQQDIENIVHENFKNIIGTTEDAVLLIEIQKIIIKMLSVSPFNRKIPSEELLKDFYDLPRKIFYVIGRNLDTY
jgi:serine/threonine protein kinase